MKHENYKVVLNRINTFLFDVDGVLTDGSVMLYSGEVIRTMSSKDSYALQYATKLGYQIFIITGGNSEEVKMRLENLGITEVVLNSANKVSVFNELQVKYNLDEKTCCYMGDDIPDYALMDLVGLAAAPQDAVPEIKQIAQYVSPFSGGKGCVRDIIEQTLKVQGKWMLPEAHEW
jgi:3-deoxy-D-manno-octulosonate 8-phosphate phosphatase (KDO 8-P phosphatase)|tara:strand:- start:665 stop:1189 length:525 start_codon:yes stop_codon:yes gene_type:complete